MSPVSPALDRWPELPLDAWRETHATLHMWLQMAGKIRLARSAWQNHSWHTTLYVTSRGLTTSPIPHGHVTFQIDFDFVDHRLFILASDGRAGGFALVPQSVAAFHRALTAELRRLGLETPFHGRPNEVEPATAFARNETNASYDPEYANRYWRILVQADRVFKIFRAGFIGKCSPVHFFWGAPDLAVTRFSGRAAPQHPGGVPNLPDEIAREAYSHEVSSCGFWAGGGPIAYPVFYSYAYPEPEGFAGAAVRPAQAFYSRELREFILPYDDVRNADAPDETLLAFLQSTYGAAATLGAWDRAALERPPG